MTVGVLHASAILPIAVSILAGLALLALYSKPYLEQWRGLPAPRS
jgi:hypothetical protein